MDPGYVLISASRHVTSPNIVVLLLMFTGVTLARYTGIEPVIAASTGTIHGYVHALHG